MNTLWLHGMGARPKEWQLKGLLDNGLKPFALHLNYCNCPAFEILSAYIKENDIKFLIGHSHGGFLGYWLSEEFGIPCLLSNPHLSIRSQSFNTPPITQRKSPLSLIVLGSDDELVDADRTLLFLEQEKMKFPDKNIKTLMLNGVGHGQDPEHFDASVKWALKEYTYLNAEK